MFSLRWRHPLPVPLFGLISFQEEHTGLIELNHDHPDAVEAMLEWLYSGDYPLAKSEDEKVNQALVSLLLNVRLYIIGEKYGIVDLVRLISDHVETPDPTWDSDSDCDWNSDISEDSSTQTPEGDSDLASGSAHDAEHAGLV